MVTEYKLCIVVDFDRFASDYSCVDLIKIVLIVFTDQKKDFVFVLVSSKYSIFKQFV